MQEDKPDEYEEEEERLFQQMREVADNIKFNFSAATVVLLVERINPDGSFTEHRITKGSTLAGCAMCRNYVLQQDEATKRGMD